MCESFLIILKFYWRKGKECKRWMFTVDVSDIFTYLLSLFSLIHCSGSEIKRGVKPDSIT
jgi:hypothetical protein